MFKKNTFANYFITIIKTWKIFSLIVQFFDENDINKCSQDTSNVGSKYWYVPISIRSEIIIISSIFESRYSIFYTYENTSPPQKVM